MRRRERKGRAAGIGRGRLRPGPSPGWAVAAAVAAALVPAWPTAESAAVAADLAAALAGPIPAEVVEVIDGDTLLVRAVIWVGQAVETRVRIAGVDAPETAGACAEERALARTARAFVQARLAAAGPAPATVRLYDVRNGKYAGRVLARVETAAGEDIGAALLGRGLARAYDGGRRQGWCAAPAPASPIRPKG